MSKINFRIRTSSLTGDVKFEGMFRLRDLDMDALSDEERAVMQNGATTPSEHLARLTIAARQLEKDDDQ